MSDQEDLSALDAAFASAEIPEGGSYGREEPPDGDYIMQVDGFDWHQGKKDPNALFFKIMLHAHGGPYDKMPASVLHNVKDPSRHGYLKKDLATLGLDLQKVSDLQQGDVLVPLLDVYVQATIKTNGQYVNCYLNELVDMGGSDIPSDLPTGEPLAGDDMPFLHDGFPSYEERRARPSRW